MDHFVAWADGRDSSGDKGRYFMKYSERDSESTPREEVALRFMMAAERAGVKLEGPMTIEQDDTK